MEESLFIFITPSSNLIWTGNIFYRPIYGSNKNIYSFAKDYAIIYIIQ